MSPSVLEIARRPLQRSEKSEERLCDDFIARFGGEVVRFSQSRASMQTLGIPDRRYRVGGVAFWWEVKAGKYRLSAEQKAYLEGELRHGEACGCGELDDLVAFVTALRAVPVLSMGWRRDLWLVEHRRDRAIELAPALIEKWRHRPRAAARGKVRRKRVK